MFSKSLPDRLARRAVAAALLVASLLAGCGVVAPADAPRAGSPVVITGAEGLAPPVVSAFARVFTPTSLVTLSDGGAAAAFVLVIAANDPADVQLRWRDAQAGAASRALRRVAAPRDGGIVVTPESAPLLEAGEGVYWTQRVDEADLAHRIAVLAPMTRLDAATRLEAYAAAASDGTPVGGDAIELARAFYYIAVVGDSVLWGNGLEDRDKIDTLVAAAIERRTGVRVVKQRLAVSAATLAPEDGDSPCGVGCFPESPMGAHSVTLQVESIEKPEQIDLLLLNGCVNDIGFVPILTPDATDDTLVAAAERYCGDEMQTLLARARERLPNAAIVVAGYYPFISAESDTAVLRVWEQVSGFLSGSASAQALSAAVRRSARFVVEAHAGIRAAVAAVDATDGPAVAFVDPEFGPSNATAAPDAWLWGLTADNRAIANLNLGLELYPEDALSGARVDVCFSATPTSGLLTCVYASVGHPNPTGARVYAEAIERELERIGVLTAGP